MGGQRERLHGPALAEALLAAGEQAGIGTAVTIRRPDGRYEHAFVNDAALAINGYERSEFMQMPPLAVLAPGEAERLMMGSAKTGGTARFETKIVHRSGRVVPIQLSTANVPWNDREGGEAIVSYFYDLTAQEHAERALRASELRLRRLIENAPDGIAVIQNDTFVYANNAIVRHLGFDDVETLMKTPIERLGLDLARPDAEDRLHGIVSESRRFPQREYRHERPDGTEVVFEGTSIPFEHDDRPAVLAFFHDITERKQLSEQMARVDRLVALGTLAAGVAHEINNPTAVATTSLEALERLVRGEDCSADFRARALRLLADALASVERVSGIVRELRGFSRADDERRPVDLGAVLASAERMTESALRARARVVRSERRAPLVWGNAGRLEQVFVNLLLNAAQAMPSLRVEDNVISIEIGQDGDTVLVEVSDNGVGIASDHLPRIFDPFFTTKPVGEGTGLGLAICHTIVTQLGGTISVSSDVGKGSTFRVRLPAATEPHLSTVPPRRAAVKRARILVVDDEPTLVRTLVTLLSEEHEVVGATSGADALSMLLASREFDLVLCDLMMPYVTGMDLYERLASERPGLERRLVFMTGGAFTPRARAFLEQVPNPRVDKPFSPAAVNDLLQTMI